MYLYIYIYFFFNTNFHAVVFQRNIWFHSEETYDSDSTPHLWAKDTTISGFQIQLQEWNPIHDRIKFKIATWPIKQYIPVTPHIWLI